MAITPVKNWEYIVNIVRSHANQFVRNRQLMLALKEALTNTGSLQPVNAEGSPIALSKPWVVVASSDSATADASDNWADSDDVVFDSAGNAHSWIHLQQADFFDTGDHLHLLIDCIPSIAADPVARVSWTRGATGYNADGTTTNRPTHAESTEELITRDGTTTAGDAVNSDMMWGRDDEGGVVVVLHVRISDDGRAGSWFVCRQGGCVNWQGWQYDEDGDSNRVNPINVWALGLDNSDEMPHWVNALNALAPFRTLDDVGFERTSSLSQPCFGGFETPMSSQNDSLERMLSSAYICNGGTSSVLSVLTDMWWGSTSDTTGAISPAEPPLTRVQVGELVIPWPSGVAFRTS